MAEWAEQWICTKFCIKLDHSSMETIQMIQKAAAMGNWWLAAVSTRQHACLYIISPAEVFGENEITQVTQLPYSPDLVPCCFWLFPKLKSPLKGKRFPTVDEIQENTMGQLMVIPTKDFAVFWIVEETLGELCEVPRCLLWRGLRCHCPIYNVSCILFSKCFYFS